MCWLFTLKSSDFFFWISHPGDLDPRKVRNETETKNSETKRNELRRNETKSVN